MDISMNNIRIGPIVHSLVKGRFRTPCGLKAEDMVVATLVDDPVDCMTCLVDRRTNMRFDEIRPLGFPIGKR